MNVTFRDFEDVELADRRQAAVLMLEVPEILPEEFDFRHPSKPVMPPVRDRGVSVIDPEDDVRW